MEVLDEFIAGQSAPWLRGIERRSARGRDSPCRTRRPGAKSIWWLYTLLVDRQGYGQDSRALLKRLAQARIQSRPLWQPCHRSVAHQGAYAYRCEVAEQLNRDGLSLPSSVGLKPADQDRVIALLQQEAVSA